VRKRKTGNSGGELRGGKKSKIFPGREPPKFNTLYSKSSQMPFGSRGERRSMITEKAPSGGLV